MGQYIMNKETGKIELHFDKAEYMALSDEQKQAIKSNFLFSRYSKAWVSRSKFPNLYRAEEVAKGLGFVDSGNVGERLTFEEQQERKAERAERRADRMEYKAERAIDRGRALQKPIDDMHGDIAFFTQPNINTSAGRTFTRRRDRMWDAWEKGFAEFKKSDYYRDRAKAAKETAANTKPTDKAFCQRRIDEANKTIRAQTANIEHYKQAIEKINAGETIRKSWNGEPLDVDYYNGCIERSEEIRENAIEKAIYYEAIIEDLGGIQFSKDNIKVGYVVRLNRSWLSEPVKVIGTGSKNITFTGTYSGKASYAEIKEIVSANEELEIEHPFRVGDEYTVKNLNFSTGQYEQKTFRVIKVTPLKVTLKCGTERAITRTPVRSCGCNKNMWGLSIGNALGGDVVKEALC